MESNSSLSTSQFNWCHCIIILNMLSHWDINNSETLSSKFRTTSTAKCRISLAFGFISLIHLYSFVSSLMLKEVTSKILVESVHILVCTFCIIIVITILLYIRREWERIQRAGLGNKIISEHIHTTGSCSLILWDGKDKLNWQTNASSLWWASDGYSNLRKWLTIPDCPRYI